MHAFVQILNPKVFSGQIWWQKLKFSTLTEIWYRYTLLYPCFEFNVNFLNFFFTRIFWANLVPNLKFSKLTKIWYQGTLLYVYHDFNICFCKIFVVHSFLGKFGSNLVPNSLIVNSFSVSQNSNCYVRVHEVHFTIR